MNTLIIYPKKLREMYESNIINAGIKINPEKYHRKILLTSVGVWISSIILMLLLKIDILYSPIVFVLFNISAYFKISLDAGARIKKMEKIFPDVISLMASNLRSGMTTDKAFMLSSRPDFDPLDKEIIKTGREITTGTDITTAFKKMGERTGSEKIKKVINLIISGLKAGGNISDLLEETARNMKEKEIIERKASSSILMYVIFTFFAVGVGAPILFGLSSILIEIIINLASRVPDAASTQMNIPFTFSKVAITANFVIYFSVTFILVTDFISSIVIGLVNKGEGKSGLRFFLPLIIMSLGLFFLTRFILTKILVESIINI